MIQLEKLALDRSPWRFAGAVIGMWNLAICQATLVLVAAFYGIPAGLGWRIGSWAIVALIIARLGCRLIGSLRREEDLEVIFAPKSAAAVSNPLLPGGRG